MASINDWATKAAERILEEGRLQGAGRPRVERIAAIIATFAEPLMELVKRSKREHDLHCARANLRLELNGVVLYESQGQRDEWPCVCGADAWNEMVDKVLAGEK